MIYSHSAFPLYALVAMLLLETNPGWAQAEQGHRTASTTLGIRIVVPPYVRILRDAHPPTLSAHMGEVVVAEQQLAVVTNERHGFCLDLALAVSPNALHWQAHWASGAGVSVTPFGSGFRVCSDRNGEFTFSLSHQFRLQRETGSLPWPIVTALAPF